MKIKSLTVPSLFKTLLLASLLFGVAAHADDKGADPSGTWTWKSAGRGGGPDRVSTLTLKVDGDKLTGKLFTPARGGKTNETAIAEGKIQAGSISFSIIRENDGVSITNKYTGKISADKLTGKVSFTRDGGEQSRDWTASRSQPAPAS